MEEKIINISPNKGLVFKEYIKSFYASIIKDNPNFKKI
jgi:hypothetical protein